VLCNFPAHAALVGYSSMRCTLYLIASNQHLLHDMQVAGQRPYWIFIWLLYSWYTHR
jgi:hypothetical protein